MSIIVDMFAKTLVGMAGKVLTASFIEKLVIRLLETLARHSKSQITKDLVDDVVKAIKG